MCHRARSASATDAEHANDATTTARPLEGLGLFIWLTMVLIRRSRAFIERDDKMAATCLLSGVRGATVQRAREVPIAAKQHPLERASWRVSGETVRRHRVLRV